LAKTSPTQRTLKHYRDLGYDCDVIERWVRNPKHPAGGFRKDCFGFADILAFNKSEIVLIQSCGQSFSAHLKKIKENPHAKKWTAYNNKLILIGWRKVKKKRGGKVMVWKPRIQEITIFDFV
jgi:hypothetical protein